MPPDITPAAPADLPAILALLAASKLPRARIEDHVASTLAARQDSGVVRASGAGRVGVAGVHHSLPTVCVGDGEADVT